MPDKRQNRGNKPKNGEKTSFSAVPNKAAEPVSVTKNDNTVPVNCSNTSASADTPQEIAARFESELVWCIEHLQIGISNDKTGGKKAQDAIKVLKILENPKAPLIKKRQAMRSAFGDYRKKMEADEKKYSTNVKKMKIEAASSPDLVKSVVYRKSATLSRKTNPTLESGEDKSTVPKNDVNTTGNIVNCDSGGNSQLETSEKQNETFNFTKSNESFKFNFEVDNAKTVDNDLKTESDKTVNSSKKDEPSLNYYKMEPSQEKFSFNFFDSKKS